MRAVLCVDVECDQREAEHPGPARWAGADAMFEDHHWLRSAMADDGAASINWFIRIDPQVEGSHGRHTWAAERYREHLVRLACAGDGLGLHPHNWRWCEPSDRWVNDGTDRWVEHVVGLGLEGFAKVFDRPCTIYRHGDRYISQTIVRMLLADPDVVVDLTLEPGTPSARGLVPTEANIGVSCHIDAALTQCFQPSDDDLQIPAIPDGRLTMVPLTTAAVPGIANLATLMLWRDPDEFERLLRLRLLDPALDHLAFAMRTDLALVREWREIVAHNLRRLRELVPDLTWVSASTMALPAGAALHHDGGVVGSMAEELDSVVNRLGLATGEVRAGSVAATVRDLRVAHDARGIDLMLARADARRAVADLEQIRLDVQALSDEREVLRNDVEEVRRELDAVEAARSMLESDIRSIEATHIWRVRRWMLPVLRPLASTARRLARVVRSPRS